MRAPFPIPIFITVTAILLGGVAVMATAGSDITQNGSKRCIASDGLPDHATGTFPNRNNPHRISKQNISVCVTANPKKGNTATAVNVPGIAINGVKIRPGTADFYDASTPRGHSRNPASGWNLDGMGARSTLGLDIQNAHVGPEGDYHYHGMPPALAKTSANTLMGYAADGFEIHYVGSNARSSYMLLPGARATAPGGAHDGTYNEDWTFVSGAGNLDQCNGGVSGGEYKYFATDTYPFFPRCLYGTEITRIR
ncbi:MAG: YHYH protein [Sulfitobacter sp.]